MVVCAELETLVVPQAIPGSAAVSALVKYVSGWLVSDGERKVLGDEVAAAPPHVDV